MRHKTEYGVAPPGQLQGAPAQNAQAAHPAGASPRFTDAYAGARALRSCVREETAPVSEHLIQCIWFDQLFGAGALHTEEGHALKVLSPGWWNHGEGPDFKGAQIEFNGKLQAGDVEVHLEAAGWRAHGHHQDDRYNQVILHVVLDTGRNAPSARTAAGRSLAHLDLNKFLETDLRSLADTVFLDEFPRLASPNAGRCTETLAELGRGPLLRFIDMAGEWRILNKARALRERMDRAGDDQALYEAFLYACGFGHFKHHFCAVARNLPYERARQLALDDPRALEAALLQIAGLMPETLPPGTSAAPHFGRLRGLRRDKLDGLRPLPLVWRRAGVRPNNNPERRLAGAAVFLARTAQAGLAATLHRIWREDPAPLGIRKSLEGLFGRPMGFWATHCTWTGKKMARATAPIGAGRARSIIGNVFTPAMLATARRERDRDLEECVFAFFAALPKEPDNRVIKVMLDRVFPSGEGAKLNFQRQQGLLQMHQDWCEPNPSCRNCSVASFLEQRR